MNWIKQLLPRIFSFLGIIITMGFAAPIYTANSNVGSTNASNITNMMGMDVLTGFGGFLLVLGVLLTAGIMQLAQGTTQNVGVASLLKGIGPAILVTILLGFMNTYLAGVNDLIQAAINDSDTNGQWIFGLFGLLGYLGIIALAFTGTGVYGAIANRVKGKKGSRKSTSAAW